MLYVRCKSCEHEFPTGISVGFAGRPVLGAHDYRCRECGEEHQYAEDDYFQKTENEVY